MDVEVLRHLTINEGACWRCIMSNFGCIGELSREVNGLSKHTTYDPFDQWLKMARHGAMISRSLTFTQMIDRVFHHIGIRVTNE